ncbi:MAG: DNA-directed RNA polymerase subunit delta [Bacillota bacterium]
MNEEVRRAAEQVAANGGSAADMVYAALKVNGSPMKVKDLIDLVVSIKLGDGASDGGSGKVDAQQKARLAARVHTEINLDLRFVYAEKGMWGLREWVKPQPVKRVITVTPRSSSGLESWLKSITGEEDEEEKQAEDDWAPA